MQNKNAAVFFFAALVVFLVGQLLAEIIAPSRAQLLQAIAIVPIIWFGRNLITVKAGHNYFWFVFALFMLSNAVIILRTDKIDYVKIKEYLFSDFRFWPYLIPLVAFSVKSPYLFGRVFTVIYWLGIIFFCVSAVLWPFYKVTPGIAEQSIWIFSSVSGFVLLTWGYHGMKRKLVATAAILLALYLSTMLARRNIMLTNINFILFGFFSYVFFARDYPTKKFLSIYAFALIVFCGIYFFQQNKHSSFKLIANRIQDDSRESVFNYYFTGMKDYMWVGKGIDGNYYCPLITDNPDIDAVEYRDLIECGYLQIILKGGYVNLALFLAIMVPAVFLGLFQSRNVFSKACGLIILLWLIDMGPYGLPTLSLRYILVWICVGVCFNKNIRLSGEDEIKKLIHRGPKAAATLHPITQQ